MTGLLLGLGAVHLAGLVVVLLAIRHVAGDTREALNRLAVVQAQLELERRGPIF